MEAGIEHQAAAAAIQRRDGIPTSRQAVTKVVNGHLVSGGLRIERRLVELLRERLQELGKDRLAKRITLEWLGWSERHSQNEAGRKVG